MAPLPEELGAHGLNRTDQSQSYPKLRKSDLTTRQTWLTCQGRPRLQPLQRSLGVAGCVTETFSSGPSGSANHMELHARARVAVPLTLPLDVERTKTVRPGPSGSALNTELHAQARAAVPTTLPLDVERTGSTPSHCHSTSSVPKMSRCLPVTLCTRGRWSSRAWCPVTPASSRRPRTRGLRRGRPRASTCAATPPARVRQTRQGACRLGSPWRTRVAC